MSITIKDIAKMINVSHTTVSRALNDSPLISEETKRKVRKIAARYNYTPNVNARSLVLSKSSNIGLFFSTLKKGTSSSFFMDAVRGANGIIKEFFNLSVEGLDDFEEFSKITPENFDGIILMSQSNDDDAFIDHVLRKNIPFVLLNRESDRHRVMTILADDAVGSYKATEWLISRGHRKIALLEGKKEFRTSHRRKQGYLDALKDNDIPFDPDRSIIGNYDLESGYKAMKKLLQADELPTAVFCLNDDMAVGAMKAIYEKKLNIPDDISVIGYDDSIFAAYLTPSLTTVSRPIELMSAEGARKLLEILKGINVEIDTIFLKTELKIRESVRKLRQETE